MQLSDESDATISNVSFPAVDESESSLAIREKEDDSRVSQEDQEDEVSVGVSGEGIRDQSADESQESLVRISVYQVFCGNSNNEVHKSELDVYPFVDFFIFFISFPLLFLIKNFLRLFSNITPLITVLSCVELCFFTGPRGEGIQ